MKDSIGWRVGVRRQRLSNAIRPKDHIARLRSALPRPYAPLTQNGQGIFRDNVRSIEHACRITRVERMEHLIASHIQPWRDSSNEERLDGENGLLLTPTVDHLFDKGFISFENAGQLIVSPVADPVSLKRMGIDREARANVGAFSEGQRRYLEFHRENVLRMARGLSRGEHSG